jgi:hypothetical protein
MNIAFDIVGESEGIPISSRIVATTNVIFNLKYSSGNYIDIQKFGCLMLD